MDKKLLKYQTIGAGIFVLFLTCLFLWVRYPDAVKVTWWTLKLVFWPLIKALFRDWFFTVIIVSFFGFLILKKLYFRK